MAEKKVEQILEGVLKKIKPTDEGILKDIEKFIENINSEIKKKKIKAKAVVGGSIAKDTYLQGDHDCDVFLQFDYSYKDKDLSKSRISAIL